MNKLFVIVLLCAAGLNIFSQSSQVTLSGVVRDVGGNVIDDVTISCVSKYTTSDKRGRYKLKSAMYDSVYVSFQKIGYVRLDTLLYDVFEDIKLDAVLKVSIHEFENVTVIDKLKNVSTFVDVKDVSVIPGVNDNVEDVIKTLPGVSSNNEMSNQYSVRSGNFDENLVYVNGIRVYRPQLIRTSKHEGLSFINPELISSIRFSAGGFDAGFGDKMSSVLDVKYKEPTESEHSIKASFMGGAFNSVGKIGGLKYLMSARYKNTSILLGTLDEKGEYKPSYFDGQLLLIYNINKIKFEFLSNYVNNTYSFLPEEQVVNFGTNNNAFNVFVDLEGNEKDNYLGWHNTLKTTLKASENLKFNFMISHYNSTENERFDFQGQYLIQDLNGTVPIEEKKENFNFDVGTELSHARNHLYKNLTRISHNGEFKFDESKIIWGGDVIADDADLYFKEWTMIDSSGYTLPAHKSYFTVDSRFVETSLSSLKANAFIQGKHTFNLQDSRMSLNLGLRTHFNSLSDEILFSPRMIVSYQPNISKNIVYKLAYGWYNQAANFKQIIGSESTVIKDLKAQKSVHYVLGVENNFNIGPRQFKFTLDGYYKHMKDIIPYKLENVRIIYDNSKRAKGYATGVEAKLMGEFVKDVDSWITMSVMQSKEDIEGDGKGFIRRPNDQRFNMSLFYRDYLPRNKTYTLNVNAVYGTGLPISLPKSDNTGKELEMPSYRRVDLGITKIFINKPASSKGIHYFSLTTEIFNVFDINNTISYFWVSDVNGASYAVPNYLTSRRVNLKLVCRF